ncbi:MAG: EAL domain-containing protein [Oscillospiraceae bacterium]
MDNNQNKLIRYIFGGMTALIVLICLISVYFIGSAKQDLYLEKVQYLTEVSSKSADLIKSKVDDYLSTLESISIYIGGRENFHIKDAVYTLIDESEKNQFQRMGIISLDGMATTTDGDTFDFSGREYFKKALAGKSVVSDLIIDKVDGSETNVFATPIKHNKEIIAVLFATQSIHEFSNTLSVESFGLEGYSYVIKKDGTSVIYTSHKNSIGRYDNLFEAMKLGTPNKQLIEDFRANMQVGKSGTFSYGRDGIPRQVSYTKVGVNDWYIISVVPISAIANSSDKLVNSIVVAATIILLCTVLLGYLLIRFLKKTNKRLETMAYTDVVTGYSNWNKFGLDYATLLRRNPNKKYAIIKFDIDKFKVINDIYGHKRGNEVLQHIADVLMQSTDELETFARTSADHFNILLCYNEDEDIIARVNAIKKQVTNYIDGYTIRLTFGIYKIGTNMHSIRSLSDRANIARLSTKAKSNVDFSFFNEETRKLILKENEIENCMDFALKNHEFEVYLQPKYLFETEKIVGAEALVRWNRREKGILCPDSFIPLFEKNGFVRNLDKYMFEQVCILLSNWKAFNNFVTPIAISVNFSRIHLSDGMLVKDLLEIAKRHEVDPKSLEIEITETAVFDNMGMLIEVMQDLKDAGFTVSIDDFGSGYSSLNILKDVPAGVIKMDKGFLDETTDNARGKMIVSSLIKMTKELGLCTVAEGVETLEQVNFLKIAGCDIAQGYYYAKPMPIKDFEKLLQQQKLLETKQD